jgi:hypothetical protein
MGQILLLCLVMIMFIVNMVYFISTGDIRMLVGMGAMGYCFASTLANWEY